MNEAPEFRSLREQFDAYDPSVIMQQEVSKMAFKSGGTVNVDTAKLAKDVHRLRVDINDHFQNHPTAGTDYSRDITDIKVGWNRMQDELTSLKKELDTMHRWRRDFEKDPLKLIRITTNNFVLDLDKGKKKEEPMERRG